MALNLDGWGEGDFENDHGLDSSCPEEDDMDRVHILDDLGINKNTEIKSLFRNIYNTCTVFVFGPGIWASKFGIQLNIYEVCSHESLSILNYINKRI